MQTALVVEDIPAVSRALAARLVRVFPDIVVRQAASLAQARDALAAETPELLLLDIGLPDGEGTSLMDGKTLSSSTMVVMTTIFDDDEHLFSALRAGAQGYLLKDDPEDMFVAALHGIVQGQPPLSPEIARKVLAWFRPAPAANQLSPREQEVLVLIARGYSVKRVAEALSLSPNTAAGYLKSIYQKLHINSRAEATMKAIDLGLVKR